MTDEPRLTKGFPISEWMKPWMPGGPEEILLVDKRRGNLLVGHVVRYMGERIDTAGASALRCLLALKFLTR